MSRFRSLGAANIAAGRRAPRPARWPRALLRVLQARGLAVGDQERAVIEGCSDVARRERWLARAVTVVTAAEMIEG